MILQNYLDVAEEKQAPGVYMRVLAGPREGAPNFIMRLFEVQPGSSTPYHSHNWEHEVFFIEGCGAVKCEKGEKPVREGDVVFVAPDEDHCFINNGNSVLRFICVIPRMEQ